MSAAASSLTPDVPDVAQLRERMQRMTDGVARVPLPVHPALSGVVSLHAGSSYEVDGLALAMTLLAGPSRAGDWCAVVGVPDFGAEAAAELGVDLGRTVLVPDPGEQWLEVTAALVDVTPVVLLRPGGRVTPAVAERLGARLRKRSAVLLVQGSWPRSEARLSADEPAWSGLGRGHGHLSARRVSVSVRRGAAPPRRTDLWLPDPAAGVRRAVPGTAPLTAPRVVREAG
ncbi:hypothetical protein [Nocardioides dongkuii]|uniref:hypothetical protein n=1 Tax=Nocardioides dongkuii TaxID=2760089 RepID=UPI0015F79B52|nr:hypothetical protein [Nocardioides dongkuii]